MNTEERDELLIRLDERTEALVEWKESHDEKHNRLSLAFISAVVSLILSLGATVMSLIVLLARSGGG